jgi:hypothetical protein
MMRQRMRRLMWQPALAFPVFAVGFLFLSPFARAAGDGHAKERAARKACLAGDTAKGVALLAELFIDTRDATHIYNQARCFEQNHRYEDAISRYREFLKKSPRLSEKDRADVEKQIAECKGFLSPGAPITPIVPNTAPATEVPTIAQPGPAAPTDGRSLGIAPPIAATSGNLGDGSVPVDFSGPEGYVIRTTNQSGASVECVSPCALRLKPGQANVHVVGHFDQTIHVPNHPASARLSLRRTGWIVTGAVIGAAGLIGAVALYSVGAHARDWSPVPGLLGVAGFGLMTGTLLTSHNRIEVESTPAAASPWQKLAFGLQPRPNGGVFVTGMRY